MSLRGARPGVVTIVVFAVFAIVLRAYTATLVVDPNGGTPFTTIQSAINAAVPGQDDVFARCGRYQENVVMRDGVSLKGAGPGCATIDAGHNGPAVRMPTITQPTVLEGFTIRSGEPISSAVGAGIDVYGGSPEIRGNVIVDNALITEQGPAIYLGTDFTIPSAPVITRNVISGNGGGGMYLDYPEGAVVTSNLIDGNKAYYGGGILVAGYADTNALIANNTIVGNVAYLGGAIYAASSVKIANNVLASNRAIVGTGGGGVYSGAPVIFENNDAYQNIPNNYSVQNGDPTGTNGNISVDPKFVDTVRSFAGYQPRSDSALVDRGSNASGSARDIRGLVRPIDGNADGISRVDIGARENEGLTNLRAAGVAFTWDRGNLQPETYNVYRGDLTTLRQSGVYTQNPGSVPGAAHFCDLETPELVFGASDPQPGESFFYLVVANGAVEGTLGFNGNLVERAKSLSCQSGP